MSRKCLVDRCGNAALAGQPMCIKHGVMTPQGLREDLRSAWSARFSIDARIHDGEQVPHDEIAAVVLRAARLEAAVRAYWLIEAGDLASPAEVATAA